MNGDVNELLDDELLHHPDMRRIHTEMAARAPSTPDPQVGFASVGLCGACVTQMSRDVLRTAADEIDVPTPTGPAAVELAFQVYSYGILLGLEIARTRDA